MYLFNPLILRNPCRVVGLKNGLSWKHSFPRSRVKLRKWPVFCQWSVNVCTRVAGRGQSRALLYTCLLEWTNQQYTQFHIFLNGLILIEVIRNYLFNTFAQNVDFSIVCLGCRRLLFTVLEIFCFSAASDIWAPSNLYCTFRLYYHFPSRVISDHSQAQAYL